MIYLINFLLAVSATIGMSLIPILCTENLGFSLLAIGLLEGGSEFLSSVLKVLNGVLYDRIKNKQLLFVGSTFLSLLSKAVLLVAAPWAILFSKVTDRLSNGAFATPRDAYVGAVSLDRGKAMGLLSSARSAGCVVGPLLVGIVTYFLGSLQDHLTLFILVCVVASATSMILSCFLKIPKTKTTVTKVDISLMKIVFKQVSPCLGIVFVFFLSRFNDGVLLLYLKHQGFPAWFYISTIAIFNFFMIFSSIFIGRQVDQGRTKAMEFMAIGAMSLFSLIFLCVGQSYVLAILGMMLWGIQRSGVQIVFDMKVMLAVEKKYYGTALGFLYLISGLGTLIAASLCGWLVKFGYEWVFIWSGLLSFGLLPIVIKPHIFRAFHVQKS